MKSFELGIEDIIIASAEAKQKFLQTGRSINFNPRGSAYLRDFMGACGEIAVAKLFGQKWKGYSIDTRKDGDVGNLEVRTTSKPDGGLFFIWDKEHPQTNDNPDRNFVLCVFEPRATIKIMGYADGRYIAKHGFRALKSKTKVWRDSYVLAQNKLKPIEELLK